MVEALIGCVAGAVLVTDTESHARAADLANVEVKIKRGYVEAMESFEDPLYQKIVDALPPGTQPADFIASVDITARKPGQACCCSGGC
jgi:hypothetical protein